MDVFDKMTPRQREVYEFIRSKIRDRGYGPTVREIGDKFGIRSPNGVVCHLKALERKGMISREANRSRAIRLTAEATHGLPLLGRIAAGVLHEAVEQQEWIDFGSMFDTEERDMFVLEVHGESMIEDHIADGDYVVIKKKDSAANGDTVVALTESNEATLKRWFLEEDRIRLEPANAKMEPIYVKDAKILGVLVGVVRKV